jgi:hypothetical protein
MDMPDKLLPASEAETLLALAYALKHDGRRAFRTADEYMAQITAAHLLAHLERSGFVLMKRPPRSAPTTPRSRGDGPSGDAE